MARSYQDETGRARRVRRLGWPASPICPICPICPILPESPPDGLAPALERSLRARQADRLPSVAAAVVREGALIWSGAVGLADAEAGREATPETQYRVGSITKTFTAVAVMQLRDEGKLDLDDRLEQHLPGIAHRSPTLRRMLAHLSGFQREAGEMFVSGTAPTIDELLAAIDTYELVVPAARAHHYGNLAYALLGEVVARRAGVPYTDYVDEKITGVLGLARDDVVRAGAICPGLSRRRVRGHPDA